jgi:hypothetical protein
MRQSRPALRAFEFLGFCVVMPFWFTFDAIMSTPEIQNMRSTD